MLYSKDFSDDQIPQLEFTKVILEMRHCQILCKRSYYSTTLGSLPEFIQYHQIRDQVERERPYERHQELKIKMRELHKELDDELFKRCFDYVDRLAPYTH